MELLLIKYLDLYKSPGKHVWKESRELDVRNASTTQEQRQARLAQPEGQLQRQGTPENIRVGHRGLRQQLAGLSSQMKEQTHHPGRVPRAERNVKTGSRPSSVCQQVPASKGDLKDLQF